MKTAFLRLSQFLALAALLPACTGSSVTVTGPSAPPGFFNLSFPANAQNNVSLSPSFSWTGSIEAASYTFQISTNSSFSSILFEQQSILDTFLSPALGLAASTQYFWRVTAYNSLGSRMATGAPFSFTTLPPPPGAFTLTAPSDTLTNVSLSPSFSWTASTDAASYTFQISTDSLFGSLLFEQQNILVTSLTPTLSLTNSTQYFWRVVAINLAGSRTATAFSFTTLAPPPAPPGAFTMTAPANLATVVARIPTFTWGAASGAMSYTVQVSTDNLFGSFVVNQAGVGTTSLRCPVLLGSLTVYYWRVTAVNTGGPTQATGAPFSFTTANTPPGSLDDSFGTGGKALINMSPGGANCHAMLIQPDGKIVIGGSAGNGVTPSFAVARLNDDGSFDTTFGGTGYVLAPMGISGEDIRSVALQTDGKIIAAGFASFGGVYKFAIARFNSDGSLDSGFGTGGRVITDVGNGNSSFAEGVVVQADGKIVAAGYAVQSNIAVFALVRYKSDGTLDTAGFGTNGITTTIVTTDDNSYLYGLAIQADQKLVVAGQTVSPFSTNNDSVVVRYKTDGTLDTTGFGTGGIARVPVDVSVDDTLSAIVIQPDQKILVSGWVQNGGNGFDHNVTLLRLTTAGVLDTTFNTTGIVTTSIDTRQDEGRSIALQGDGKIVIAALATRPDTTTDFAALRYTSSGALDTTFNGTGVVRTVVGTASSDARAVAIDALGRIVVAGNASSATEGDAAVVRYWP